MRRQKYIDITFSFTINGEEKFKETLKEIEIEEEIEPLRLNSGLMNTQISGYHLKGSNLIIAEEKCEEMMEALYIKEEKNIGFVKDRLYDYINDEIINEDSEDFFIEIPLEKIWSRQRLLLTQKAFLTATVRNILKKAEVVKLTPLGEDIINSLRAGHTRTKPKNLRSKKEITTYLGEYFIPEYVNKKPFILRNFFVTWSDEDIIKDDFKIVVHDLNNYFEKSVGRYYTLVDLFEWKE